MTVKEIEGKKFEQTVGLDPFQERLALIYARAKALIFPPLEFLVFTSLLGVIVYYEVMILFSKQKSIYRSEAVNFVKTLSENWKGALIILAILLYRPIILLVERLKRFKDFEFKEQ